jgi:hypothetical protein
MASFAAQDVFGWVVSIVQNVVGGEKPDALSVRMSHLVRREG